MTSINDRSTHEIRTVIKGTNTIAEYNSTKETLIKLAEEAYCNHLNDGEWTHGEPITARFSDRNGNLLVAYNDMTVIEYDSDLNPLKINDGMEIAQNKEKDRLYFVEYYIIPHIEHVFKPHPLSTSPHLFILLLLLILLSYNRQVGLPFLFFFFCFNTLAY